MKFKFFVFGIATWVPGVFKLFAKPTGGTSSARYCYSVWLRHLVRLHSQGVRGVPSYVAELGPGDSLGVGLAALISGSDRYTAVERHKYCSQEQNLLIFEELIELFKNRAPIPDDDEFPRMRPSLDTYDFPSEILTEETMQVVLAQERIQKLRNAFTDNLNNSHVEYVLSWESTERHGGKYDLVLAQSVMEYVDDLQDTYKTICRVLKKGGYATFVIDYTAHHLSKRWDEHWTYSDLLWKCLRGRQPYFLNRKTHSLHEKKIKKAGLKVVFSERTLREPSIRRSELSKKYHKLPPKDFETSGGFFIAVSKE